MGEVTVAGRQCLRNKVDLHRSGQIDTIIIAGWKATVFIFIIHQTIEMIHRKCHRLIIFISFDLYRDIIRTSSGKKL